MALRPNMRRQLQRIDATMMESSPNAEIIIRNEHAAKTCVRSIGR